MLKIKSNSENINPLVQQIVSVEINGFCSKLKSKLFFRLINPKILHFPNPEPLKAKSIIEKGIQSEMSFDKMVKINTKMRLFLFYFL